MKRRWLAKAVEYYPETDEILLIRCPECGRENYAPAVASGVCVWCGFNGRELLNEKKGTELQKKNTCNGKKKPLREDIRSITQHHPAMTILISRLSGRTMTDFNI